MTTQTKPTVGSWCFLLCVALTVAPGCSATRPLASAPPSTEPQLMGCGSYAAPPIISGNNYIRVTVRLTVDANGRVAPSGVRVIRAIANPQYASQMSEARARAVSDATACSFVPATRGGVAVRAEVTKVFVYNPR